LLLRSSQPSVAADIAYLAMHNVRASVAIMTEATLTDVDVRAYLRAATRAKILGGWYNFGTSDNITWIVTPIDRTQRSQHMDSEAVRIYCEMLAEAGIEPEYRA
jgi:hypothetical protein